MAILNHGSTLRTADGGQTTTTIVTAANIGTYGVATNSTYYVGTTQNIFNRASGAQTLTGVSIDGNAANITAYTVNQNVGTGNAPSFTGMTSTAMLISSTSLTNGDDWSNSPISIRERGLVSAAQSINAYSPNINFHWASRISNSLWMDANGNLAWGSYSETGVPSSDGAFYAANLYASIYYDKNDTAYYVDPASNSRLLNLGLGNVTPDLRLSVSGDAQLSGILYLGGTAGSYNSWGSRTYTTSGVLYNNSSSVEFNNYGYGSTWTFTLGGGNATSSGAFRAPVFYDSDNTAYYLDAANSTTSLLVAGKVGIGTTSPLKLLHVHGTNGEVVRLSMASSYTAGNGPQLSFWNATSEELASIRGVFNETGQGNRANLIFGTRTSDALGVETKMTILHNGNVGIGTTTPVSKLHVVGEGDTVTLQKSNNVPAMAFLGTSTNKSVIEGGDTFNFYTGGSSRFYIKNDGNVGIGTTSPAYKLDVNGTTRFGGIVYNEAVKIDDFNYFNLQPYVESETLSTILSVSGTTPTFTTLTNTAAPFSKVLSVSAYGEAAMSDFIPVQAGETIYGEIWAYRATGAAGTAGVLYCGVQRYDKDKKMIDGNAGLNTSPSGYFIASNQTIPSNSTWTKYSGTLVLPTSHTPYNGSDGGPVRYIRPYIIYNYTGGTILTYIGGWKIRKTELTRDSGIVTINGNLSTARIGNINVGSGTYLNTITPVGDTNINLSSPSGAFYFDTFPRMPGFYDSNDTNYYVDPASTSILNGTRHNTVVAGSTSAMTNAGQLAIYSSANPYISFHDGGVGRTAYMQETGGIFYFGEVTYTESEGSFRAPLFYDTNNTAYYLDPASTSNLNNITAAGTLTVTNIAKNSTSPIVINSGLSASLGLRVYYDMNLYNTLTFTDSAWNSQGSIFGSSSVVTINAATATTSFVKYAGYSQEGGSFRAPIFYDSDNTAYYIDGASGSKLKYLQIDGDWGSSPFGSGHESFTIRSTYASMVQRQTNGALAYWLHHIAGDGAYNLYGGRGATDGNSWDWAYRAYPSQDGNYVEFNTSARAQIFYDRNDTTYYLDPANTGTSLLVAGKVGIGTTSPGAPLEVSGTSGDSLPTFKVTSTTAPNSFNYAGTILNSSLGAGRNYVLFIGKASSTKNAAYIGYNHSGTDGSNTNFLTLGHYASDNLLNILGNGNVGIGTTSPSNTKLHIVGDWVSGHSTIKTQTITSFASGGTTGIGLYDSDGTRSGYLYTNSTGTTVGSSIASPLIFETNGSERIRILSGGNVGIGTTSPANKLHVVGSAYSDADFRAPIFYDSNDTGYFLNPNSTSNLNNLRAATISAANHGLTCVYYGGGATPTNGYLITTNIDYSTFNMPTVIIEGYAYGNGVPIHLEIVWYAYLNSWTNLAYTNLGNWNPGTVSIGTNASGKVCLHLSNLIYYGRFNVRCIYDQGNAPLEGWTVTDATTSALTRVTTISKVELATSITGNAATVTNGLTTGNYNSYALPLTGGTVSGLVRINNQLQVGQNTNGTAYIDAYGGYAWFGRDSNTTGIRIDGSANVHMTNALNVVNAITQNGNQVLNASNYVGYSAFTGSVSSGGNITATSYIYTSTYLQTGGNLIYPSGYGSTQRLEVGNSANNNWIDGLTIAPGGTVTAPDNMRSPIFYDSNDTTYYTDPAGTSILNVVRANSYVQKSASQSLSGTVGCTIDVAAAGIHVLTLAASTTISSFTYNYRAPNPSVNTIMLVIKYGGTASITWTNVLWANGVTPTITGVSGYADVYMLTSYQGTTGVWIGTVVSQGVVSTSL